MDSLRFVSLSEDGAQLIVSSYAGETFSLAISDELRVAVNRRRAPKASSEPVRLSPREIQDRIRHGASSEEVAAETGMPLDRVESYAAPVRAEREHAAFLARTTEVADRTLTRDAVRAVFGEQPVTLENMVEHRASLTGVDGTSFVWDAWRRGDHQWDVRLEFDLSDTSAIEGTDLEDAETAARWVFNPLRRTMHNVNRWAQFLSELEPLESAPSNRRLTALPAGDQKDHDDDAEASAGESVITAETPVDVEGGELLDMLAKRRGFRAGSEQDAQSQADQQDDGHHSEDEDESARGQNHSAQNHSAQNHEAPQREEQDSPRTKKSLRDRRSRVPSWDQIYFGTKPDSE